MAERGRRPMTWQRRLGHWRWALKNELRLASTSPEAWLVKSFPTETMTKVEDVARFGTLVMPASHGIWLAELGSSICGLLGLWREVVLRRPAAAGPRPSSEGFLAHQRERQHRPPRRAAAPLLLALSLLRKVEVLCEMVAARFRPALKWKAIFVVEALKAAVRLLILAQLRGTTLLYDRMELRSPPPPLEEGEPSAAWQADMGSLARAQALLSACWSDTSAKGAATGARMASAVVLYDNAPTQLPSLPSALSVAGEVLYVLRPVVYVGALVRGCLQKSIIFSTKQHKTIQKHAPFFRHSAVTLRSFQSSFWGL